MVGPLGTGLLYSVLARHSLATYLVYALILGKL
jgi:hypothetical protein